MTELVCRYGTCLRQGLLDAAANAQRAAEHPREPRPELAPYANIAQNLAHSIKPVQEGGLCTGKGYCGARVTASRG